MGLIGPLAKGSEKYQITFYSTFGKGQYQNHTITMTIIGHMVTIANRPYDTIMMTGDKSTMASTSDRPTMAKLNHTITMLLTMAHVRVSITVP